MSNGRTKYAWIGMILIHFSFLFWQSQNENWLLQDSFEYLHAADNLIEEGLLYADVWDSGDIYVGNYTRRPPIYP
ncbi:MAG: hypothetical protein AAF696_18470, partial [Bacteroidota bacterium]